MKSDKALSIGAIAVSVVMMLLQWGVLQRITEVAADVKDLNTRLSRLEGRATQVHGIGGMP